MQLEVASNRHQSLLSHRIKMFEDGLQIKLDPKLEQHFSGLFLGRSSLCGEASHPCLPGSEGGSGNGSFRNVRLGEVATASLSASVLEVSLKQGLPQGVRNRQR